MFVLLMCVLAHLQHQPFSLHTILTPWIIRLVHHTASTLLMGALSQTIQYIKFFGVDINITNCDWIFLSSSYMLNFFNLIVHFYH